MENEQMDGEMHGFAGGVMEGAGVENNTLKLN